MIARFACFGEPLPYPPSLLGPYLSEGHRPLPQSYSVCHACILWQASQSAAGVSQHAGASAEPACW